MHEIDFLPAGYSRMRRGHRAVVVKAAVVVVVLLLIALYGIERHWQSQAPAQNLSKINQAGQYSEPLTREARIAPRRMQASTNPAAD